MMWIVVFTFLVLIALKLDQRRIAAEITSQLLEDDASEAGTSSQGGAVGDKRVSFQGISRQRFMAWSIAGCIFFGGRVALVGGVGAQEAVFGVLGCVAGELWWRRSQNLKKEAEVRRLEFSLPMAMERVVMGVGAGLDVVPALTEAARRGGDPVSLLFARVVSLSEGGLKVGDSLRAVSQESVSPTIKHAFIHLGVAYEQGGELVRPLRELSDATQLAYQERVEEEIAKLPVKAVLPLVVTFAGLIVCFITVPLIQIGGLTKKVKSGMEQMP
jgi:Flp pilus assembly protein TadB